MKASQPWHSTPLGSAVRWLGSIQLAVPVLAVVAVALAWGTYLESTQDARVAREVVYGSWWFIGVMGLVCVSLIFAALTRLPWKRRHVGFLVVHASLVALICGGFWSLYGRVEGRIALEQGTTSDAIELNDEYLEIAEHASGQFHSIGAIPVPRHPGIYNIGGIPVEVAEIWQNVRENIDVIDGGPEPYRAVQVQFGPAKESSVWVGDEARGEAPVIAGLRIRVLAAGQDWQPPSSTTSAAQPSGYVFVVGEQRFPLGAEGSEAFPGWKVQSIKRFTHASVSAGAIDNDTSKADDNPAVDVVITDGKGNSERLTAFEKFPTMVMGAKPIEGNVRSGAKLVPAGGSSSKSQESIVIFGTPPAMKLGYIAADGSAKVLEHTGELPWSPDLGPDRHISINQQLTHAQERSSYSRAPDDKEQHRPALVLKSGETTVPIPWKGTAPIALPGGRIAIAHFGPGTVPLPFTLRLNEFRKTDYPGTDMAMAYESDVTVTAQGAPEQRTTISMNNPLVHSGWKVYQSGFVGQSVSIFSVMRDPGLPITYISCTTLCIGILITFYGRGLSWGHPGIPTPFARKPKEHSNAPSSVVVPRPAAPVDTRAPEPVALGAGGDI